MYSQVSESGDDEEEESPYPTLNNVGSDIRIRGRVIRLTQNLTVERRRTYTCSSCRAIATSYAAYGQYYKLLIPRCPNRKRKDCNGFMRLATKDPEAGDLMRFQEVMLQEINSTASIPRIFKVTLEDNLIDCCSTGNCVEVCGTVEIRANPISHSKSGITIGIRSQTVTNVEGNRLAPNKEAERQKARRRWFKLATEKGELLARDVVIRSAFDRIKGMDYTKLSLLLLLCATTDGIETVHTASIRCQPHILLVGDPGTGKSKLLQRVVQFANPSLYTNGFGCSSAGLTAACIKVGAHWMFQAGVLVLCDGGVCCIDEWNLLKPVDQASCHEAMEQQTISIAKAGIVSRMSTRCSIAAAMTLKKGLAVDVTTATIGLSTSLISRFDLILAIPDEKSSVWDLEMTDFVLGLSGDEEEEELRKQKRMEELTEEEVKAHLYWARSLKPIFQDDAYEILTAYFAFCRQDEYRDISRTTPRLQNALMRLAYGHARLCCRSTVNAIDAVVAILLMESSVGFGRLVRPLSMAREMYPLEPRKEMIETILERLQVDKSVLKRERINCGPDYQLTDEELMVLDAEEEERGKEKESREEERRRKKAGEEETRGKGKEKNNLVAKDKTRLKEKIQQVLEVEDIVDLTEQEVNLTQKKSQAKKISFQSILDKMRERRSASQRRGGGSQSQAGKNKETRSKTVVDLEKEGPVVETISQSQSGTGSRTKPGVTDNQVNVDQSNLADLISEMEANDTVSLEESPVVVVEEDKVAEIGSPVEMGNVSKSQGDEEIGEDQSKKDSTSNDQRRGNISNNESEGKREDKGSEKVVLLPDQVGDDIQLVSTLNNPGKSVQDNEVGNVLKNGSEEKTNEDPSKKQIIEPPVNPKSKEELKKSRQESLRKYLQKVMNRKRGDDSQSSEPEPKRVCPENNPNSQADKPPAVIIPTLREAKLIYDFETFSPMKVKANHFIGGVTFNQGNGLRSATNISDCDDDSDDSAEESNLVPLSQISMHSLLGRVAKKKVKIPKLVLEDDSEDWLPNCVKEDDRLQKNQDHDENTEKATNILGTSNSSDKNTEKDPSTSIHGPINTGLDFPDLEKPSTSANNKNLNDSSNSGEDSSFPGELPYLLKKPNSSEKDPESGKPSNSFNILQTYDCSDSDEDFPVTISALKLRLQKKLTSSDKRNRSGSNHTYLPSELPPQMERRYPMKFSADFDELTAPTQKPTTSGQEGEKPPLQFPSFFSKEQREFFAKKLESLPNRVFDDKGEVFTSIINFGGDDKQEGNKEKVPTKDEK